jgi:8-oxo-dGTP pyrophosphatase MutT (NUDIX family)
MDQPKIVVSALLERTQMGIKQVFVQTRSKPVTSPTYLDMLEIPAGGIMPYENVYDAIRREVLEETGLEVTRIIDDSFAGIMENRKGDKSLAFRPYLCQQVLSTNGGLPWYGFVFRCEVKGNIVMNSAEASDPRWMSISELAHFLETYPEKVFSLQYATLKKYVEEFAPNK